MYLLLLGAVASAHGVLRRAEADLLPAAGARSSRPIPSRPSVVMRDGDVRTVAYQGGSFSARVVPAPEVNAEEGPAPPLVLLPPIGVGIDRTFCDRFVDAWAAANASGAPAALHAIDVIGMGDSEPKPRMRRPFGGWAEPPRTPEEWAEQTVAYIREEVGAPSIVVANSNLCTVALEASRLAPDLVKGLVLIGPPAVEALSLDKDAEAIEKVWRVVGSPVGAALFRFARRKAFLAAFSKKNLFADPAQVDEAYLDICARGARDASSRHAVFSFVAGTWRKDYTALLQGLTKPTLIVSGRDVGSREEEAKPEVEEVDQTTGTSLLKWFTVLRGRGRAGRFSQLERDLGADPQRKLDDFVAAMEAGQREGTVDTALLPGWNVLVYESPAELAECIGAFLRRRDWGEQKAV